VHFDAHPDLYDSLGGDRLSHASPFARIMEERLVRSLTQLGIRTLNAHQREQAERFGVKIISAAKMEREVKLAFAGPVYLSIDLDVLDPAFAPGVSHYEPGGLSTRRVIEAIHAIDAEVVGADIVEYNPTRDTRDMTAYVAAKLLKEIAGKMLSK
jgi:arginase family enzyme